jgi:hypothetical protein
MESTGLMGWKGVSRIEGLFQAENLALSCSWDYWDRSAGQDLNEETFIVHGTRSSGCNSIRSVIHAGS